MNSVSKRVPESWRPMPQPPEFDVEDAVQATKYAGIPWLDCYSSWPKLYDSKVRHFVELINNPAVSFDTQLDSYLDGELDLEEVLNRRRKAVRTEMGDAACRPTVVIVQDVHSGTLEEEIVSTASPLRSFG